MHVHTRTLSHSLSRDQTYSKAPSIFLSVTCHSKKMKQQAESDQAMFLNMPVCLSNPKYLVVTSCSLSARHDHSKGVLTSCWDDELGLPAHSHLITFLLIILIFLLSLQKGWSLNKRERERGERERGRERGRERKSDLQVCYGRTVLLSCLKKVFEQVVTV